MDFHESIESADRASGIFAVLADSHRLQILSLLAEHGPINMVEMGRALESMPASVLSKHLLKLKCSGLVDCRRQHGHAFYHICELGILNILESSGSGASGAVRRGS